MSRGISEVYLRSVFNAVDTDRSGELELDELCSALSSSVCECFPLTAARMLLRMYDTDGDGTVSFPEFRSLYLYLSRIERIYGSLDSGQGLDLKKIEEALNQLGITIPESDLQSTGTGQPLLPLYVEAFDTNCSGLLTYAQFLELTVWVSFLHTLFARHDTHNAGRLVMNPAGLFSLALWLR